MIMETNEAHWLKRNVSPKAYLINHLRLVQLVKMVTISPDEHTRQDGDRRLATRSCAYLVKMRHFTREGPGATVCADKNKEKRVVHGDEI